MLVLALLAVQAQAQTVLIWEDFEAELTGTNTNITHMVGSQWTQPAPFHNTIQVAANDFGGGNVDSGKFARHPGQGGSSRHTAPLAVTGFTLADLAADGGKSIEMSAVFGSAGNSWFFTGGPSSGMTLGGSVGNFGVGGDQVRINMGHPAWNNRTTARISASSEASDTVSVDIATHDYNSTGPVSIEVRIQASTIASTASYRCLYGCTSLAGADLRGAVGAARGAYTTIGTIGLLDSPGGETIDHFAYHNAGPLHNAAADSIHVRITPEPASAALLALGSLVMLRRRWRR
jgi:hypothetical protein